MISDFDSTPQIEIEKEITKMAINYGKAYRDFKKELEKKHTEEDLEEARRWEKMMNDDLCDV